MLRVVQIDRERAGVVLDEMLNALQDEAGAGGKAVVLRVALSSGAKQHGAAREVACIEMDEAAAGGECFEEASGGRDEFAGLLHIEPCDAGFQGGGELHPGGILVGVLEQVLADEFVQVDTFRAGSLGAS